MIHPARSSAAINSKPSVLTGVPATSEIFTAKTLLWTSTSCASFAASLHPVCCHHQGLRRLAQRPKRVLVPVKLFKFVAVASDSKAG